jgi:3-oxoacyl-[acyl-carrier protein] reductase
MTPHLSLPFRLARGSRGSRTRNRRSAQKQGYQASILASRPSGHTRPVTKRDEDRHAENAGLFRRENHHHHRRRQRHRPCHGADFRARGANVVCADINEHGARETAEAVNGSGSQALALKVDVTKRHEVNDMAERAIAAFGTVQFLFNSAGAAIRRARFLDIDDALMEKTFALNVNGTFCAMQAVLPHMLANKHGVIVNIASMQHRRGGPSSSIHYAAAKGVVVTMTMGVAREFATQGIRALSISPGPVKTAFQAAAQTSPELAQQFLDDLPMKRMGEPEEIGELVLFLCSDACEFMTADTVYVNGGGGWR